jgi:hypothetical protein
MLALKKFHPQFIRKRSQLSTVSLSTLPHLTSVKIVRCFTVQCCTALRLLDWLNSKSAARKGVWVQLPPPVLQLLWAISPTSGSLSSVWFEEFRHGTRYLAFCLPLDLFRRLGS